MWIAAMSFKEIDRVMDVDFWGVVAGKKAFLPHVIASGEGHIVNISSIFGLFSVPTQSAYNAAKFAVRGFTEALRREMKLRDHPVQVTTVHPGGIKTNIVNNATGVEGHDNAKLAADFNAKLARTTPEKAAQVILKGVEKNKAKVLIGADAVVLDAMVRVLGSKYQPLVTLFSRRNGI